MYNAFLEVISLPYSCLFFHTDIIFLPLWTLDSGEKQNISSLFPIKHSHKFFLSFWKIISNHSFLIVFTKFSRRLNIHETSLETIVWNWQCGGNLPSGETLPALNICIQNHELQHKEQICDGIYKYLHLMTQGWICDNDIRWEGRNWVMSRSEDLPTCKISIQYLFVFLKLNTDLLYY